MGANTSMNIANHLKAMRSMNTNQVTPVPSNELDETEILEFTDKQSKSVPFLKRRAGYSAAMTNKPLQQ